MTARPSLLVAALLFAASFGAAFLTLRGLTSPTELLTRVVFSSDELFPEALYRDRFEDGYSFGSFQFSAATFALPDLALYAAVRPVAGSAARAALPWLTLFYLLVVGSAALAARAGVPADRRGHAVAGVLLLGAAYLGVNCLAGFEHRQLGEFYLPLYHGGAAMAAFLGLALVAGLLRSPAPWRSWRAAALVLVAAGATFSDRLFAVWFPAPMAGAAVVAGLLGGREARQEWPGLAGALLATAVGCGLGAGGVNLLLGPGDALGEYWDGFNPAETVRLLGVLAVKVLGEAAGGNPVLIAGLGWLGVSLVALVLRAAGRRAGPAGDDRFVFLAAFSLLCAGTTSGVVCLSRFGTRDLEAFPWEECSRYFLAPQAVGWFGWAVLFAHFAGGSYPRPDRLAATAGPAAAVAGLLAVAALWAGPPVRDVLDFYPPDVRDFDEMCRARGLTTGLGDYGTAKRVTFLSRAGVRIQQVWPAADGPRPFAAAYWLSNAEWYWKPPRGRSGPVRYQFVVAHADHDRHPWLLDPERVVAAFGEPAARVRVERATVLVYDRPTDTAFREFAATDPGVRGMRERFDPPGE